MTPRAHPSRSSEPGALSRLLRSLRRTLARLLLPDEVPSSGDLAAVVPNPRGDGLWTLDRKGNIFAFVNAPELREVPEPVPLRQVPFVALACTPSGHWLWALDSEG